MSEETTVTASRGNVFADLGFDNPEEERLKAQLVREIRDVLKSRRLTQTKAAELLGLKQSDVSAIVHGQTQKFSIDRLLRCIRSLGLYERPQYGHFIDRIPRLVRACGLGRGAGGRHHRIRAADRQCGGCAIAE